MQKKTIEDSAAARADKANATLHGAVAIIAEVKAYHSTKQGGAEQVGGNVLEEGDFTREKGDTREKLKASHVWAILAAYRRSGEKAPKGAFKQHIFAANHLLQHGVLPPPPSEDQLRRDNSDSEGEGSSGGEE